MVDAASACPMFCAADGTVMADAEDAVMMAMMTAGISDFIVRTCIAEDAPKMETLLLRNSSVARLSAAARIRTAEPEKRIDPDHATPRLYPNR
jgi:hypothetical protein